MEKTHRGRVEFVHCDSNAILGALFHIIQSNKTPHSSQSCVVNSYKIIKVGIIDLPETLNGAMMAHRFKEWTWNLVEANEFFEIIG